MTKKKIAPFMVLALAVSLLVVTAFAGASEQTGYEAFKEVLKNQQNLECNNGTLAATLEIIDNGETKASLTGVITGDHKKEMLSGELSLNADDLNKKIAIYANDQQFCIHDLERDDVYVTEIKEDNQYEEESCGFDQDHEMTTDEEAILDYFVGDLANAFSVEEKADGSEIIKLELQKNEIPEIVNLLASIDKEENHGHKQAEDQMHQVLNSDSYPLFKEIMALETDKTELVDDIEMAYLKVELEVDAQKEMVGMAFEVKVSGEDANQMYHTVIYKGTARVKDRNESQVTELDLTDKNVIEMPEFEE